ncbi:hypothetical protein I2750_20875, partial [Bacillus sp. PR5]|nr:hypothetical protein [Bacillus sp. PR5]
MGPPFPNELGQFYAVHSARHFDIGDHEPDGSTILQTPDSFICIVRFKWPATARLHHVSRIHPDERMIVDDQYDTFGTARNIPHDLCGPPLFKASFGGVALT